LGPSSRNLSKNSLKYHGFKSKKIDEESDHEDLKLAQKMQDQNRYKLEPPQLNEDGSEIFELQSRLMMKL
jgi:hypothetical protein